MFERVTDLQLLICAPETTVRTVLARINAASPHLFQVVVDETMRPVGTVTDGDLRRALLGGINMDDPIAHCMHAPPIIGAAEDGAGNRIKLTKARFLPLVDADGVLSEVMTLRRFEPVISRALVMAGGFGRRLGDRTRDRPKPLLEVGDRPIIDRVLEQLEHAGIGEIDISVHYLADQFERFVAERRNTAVIRLLREDRPLGTAGALSMMSMNGGGGPILVINGDVLTRVDLSALQQFHLRHDHDGTIAVARYDVKVPFGVLKLTSDGLFAGIDEKPTMTHLIAAGIYCLSPEFQALVPSGRPIDMPEVLELGHKAGLKVGLFPVHEYWIDVGRPEDLATAHADHVGK